MRIDYHNDNLLDIAASYWNQRVRRFRITGTILGLFMVLLGVLCLIFPFQSAYIMELFVSLVILAAGIGEVIAYARMPVYLRFGSLLASGLMNILFGLLLITSPKESMVDVFAFLLALDLLVVGIEQLGLSSKLSLFTDGRHGWIIFGGVLNVIAAVIFLFLPKSTLAFLSIFVAVYLLSGGVCLLAGAISAKELKVRSDVIDTTGHDL